MRNVQDRPHVVIRYFSREQRVSLGITHARSAARDGEVKAEGIPRIVENGTERASRAHAKEAALRSELLDSGEVTREKAMERMDATANPKEERPVKVARHRLSRMSKSRHRELLPHARPGNHTAP